MVSPFRRRAESFNKFRMSGIMVSPSRRRQPGYRLAAPAGPESGG